MQRACDGHTFYLASLQPTEVTIQSWWGHVEKKVVCGRVFCYVPSIPIFRLIIHNRGQRKSRFGTDRWLHINGCRYHSSSPQPRLSYEDCGVWGLSDFPALSLIVERNHTTDECLVSCITRVVHGFIFKLN